MKKILFFIPSLYHGGAETQFRYLINGINTFSEYKISVLSLEEIDFESNFVKNNQNIKFHSQNFNFTNYSNSRLKYFIYIFNYFFLFLKLLFSKNFKKYDVVISYGMILAPLIPIINLFNKKIIFSIRTATKILYKRKYLKIFLNKADIVTCNSPHTKKILQDIGVKNIKFIPNGINTKNKKFNKMSYNIKNIYVIGRIHPIKNQQYVLRAFKDLKDKNLCFVGKIVDKNYYKKLKEFVHSNKMEEKVKFIEFTDNMENIYKKADLVVLPSYEEGVSNVILESFLYKVLCLASNIPQNSFIIRKNEFLFNLNDPNDLSKKIHKIDNILSKHPELIKEEIENNYKYLLKNYTIEKMIDNYMYLF